MLLPATQTYSDGKVVKWDEPTPASGDEPENPAPALVVTAAGATGSGGMGPMGSASPTARPPDRPRTAPTAAATTSGSDPVARGLGGAALVVAAAGLVLAVTARRRRTARG